MCSAFWMPKVSSTNLIHIQRGMRSRPKVLDLKPFHEQVDYDGAHWGTHDSTIDLSVILTLEEEVCVFETELW